MEFPVLCECAEISHGILSPSGLSRIHDGFKQGAQIRSASAPQITLPYAQSELTGRVLGANRQHLKFTLDGIFQRIKFDDTKRSLWV